MRYLLLLFSFSTFGNCDLYKGREIRLYLCYNEPLIFAKLEAIDEMRESKYKGSTWVKDPRELNTPSKFYLTTILNGGNIKYND